MAENSHTFPIEIYTPEGEVFTGDVEMVSTRTQVGSIGVKANHIPILARLVPALLRLHQADGEVTEYAQGEGWLQAFANEATLLCEEALPFGDLDADDLRERVRDAEQRINEAEEDSASEVLAQREKARAEAFLEVLERGS